MWLYKIVQDEQIGKYRIMSLEKNLIYKNKFNFLKIGNQLYANVPVFDMPGCYAIEDNTSHIGEKLEFIWIE